MSLEQFRDFKSTNVDSLFYDDHARQLTVGFKNGSRYIYSGVTSKRWHDLKHAKSIGGFVASKIAPLGGRKIGSPQ